MHPSEKQDLGAMLIMFVGVLIFLAAIIASYAIVK